MNCEPAAARTDHSKAIASLMRKEADRVKVARQECEAHAITARDLAVEVAHAVEGLIRSVADLVERGSPLGRAE